MLPSLFFLSCPLSFAFPPSPCRFSFSLFSSLSLPPLNKSFLLPTQFFFFSLSSFSPPLPFFFFFSLPPFPFSFILPPCHSFSLLPCPFYPLPQFHLFITLVALALSRVPGRGALCKDKNPLSSHHSLTPIPYPQVFLPSFFPAGGLGLPWGSSATPYFLWLPGEVPLDAH